MTGDVVVCGSCGRTINGNKEPSNWRPDGTRRCFACFMRAEPLVRRLREIGEAQTEVLTAWSAPGESPAAEGGDRVPGTASPD